MKSINGVLALFLLLAIALGGCTIPTGADVGIYVTDESGNPVDGATVNAYTTYAFSNSAGEKWQSITGTIQATVTTNADGYANILLPAGNYAFSAYKDNAYGGVEQQIVNGQNTVRITVKVELGSGTLAVNFINEDGSPFNVEINTLRYNMQACLYSNCSFSYREQIGENPTTISLYAPSFANSFVFYSEGFVPNRGATYTVNPGETVTDTITLAPQQNNARETHLEGDIIQDLFGAGEFDGSLVNVEFGAVTNVGATTPAYVVDVSLYDDGARLISARTAGEGENLANLFFDGPVTEGQLALKTGILIDKIGVGQNSGVPYIEVTINPENPTNTVTLEQFNSFDSPYSSIFYLNTLTQIEGEYGSSVNYVFRHFPLNSTPDAEKADEASECARSMGMFREYAKAIFNNVAIDDASLKQYAAQLGLDTATFNNCLDNGRKAKDVRFDYDEALALGQSGTPYAYIGKEIVIGARPYDDFKLAIDNALNNPISPEYKIYIRDDDGAMIGTPLEYGLISCTFSSQVSVCGEQPPATVPSNPFIGSIVGSLPPDYSVYTYSFKGDGYEDTNLVFRFDSTQQKEFTVTMKRIATSITIQVEDEEGNLVDPPIAATFEILDCDSPPCQISTSNLETNPYYVETVAIDRTIKYKATFAKEEFENTVAEFSISPGDNLNLQVTMKKPGPVSLWHLDEAAGATTFKDSAGANDGTCSGSGCPSAGAGIKGTNARVFNGTTNSIKILDSPGFALGDKATVSAWVYPTAYSNSYPNIKGILSKYQTPNANGLNLTLGQPFSKNMFFLSMRTGGMNHRLKSSIVDLNKWHFVAGVYDGRTIRLYVNGALVDSQTATGNVNNPSDYISIGSDYSGDASRYFKGTIDEVAIWNRALSEAEIQALAAP